MISETNLEAGGKYRAKEFLNLMWNQCGGNNICRFPYNNLDMIRIDLEKTMNALGLEPRMMWFLRVSDSGLLDLDRNEAEKVRKERAQEGIEVDRKIIEALEQSEDAGKVRCRASR